MKLYRILLVVGLLLTSCQTATQPSIAIPTSLPTSNPTSTSSPIPTATNTLEPTSTPEPSPTPIVLPDIINQTFSGVSITYHDSFEYIMQNLAPQGWQTDQQYGIWVTKENQLEAQPLLSSIGEVFYYSNEIITPNKGVFFKFKYTGTVQDFTLGFDNVLSNGERVTGADFHSVAVDIKGGSVLVHGIQRKSQISGSLKGTLKQLHEDTWYNIALAFDKNNNYIIKIWEPDNSENQITHLRNWKDFPNQYYFISWVSSKRTLLIDDFTVFTFDEITQN